MISLFSRMTVVTTAAQTATDAIMNAGETSRTSPKTKTAQPTGSMPRRAR